MKRMFNNGRFANVTAIIALVFAMGGTSYAAYTLPHNSVGSWQIKYKSVKNADIGTNAITSSKVLDGSLQAQDFDVSNLPAGPQGEPGEAVAHATLDQYGVIAAAAHKNITQGNVFHTNGTGIYCFSGMTIDGQYIDPTTAMVTLQSGAAPAATDHIADVAIGYGLTGCGGPGGVVQVRVDITKISIATPTLDDHGFSVWLEK